MLNVGNWLSPCRRLGVSPLVRPPIFDKLIQWACGSPKTLDDGTVIVEDKKGKSGLADGREQIPSAYLEGDGIMWVDLNGFYAYSETEDIIISFTPLSTVSSDLRFYSENDTTGASVNPFYGLGSGSTDATKFRIFIRGLDGTQYLDAQSTLTVFDGAKHECIYSDVGGTVTLTVDGTTETLGTYSRPTLAQLGVNGSAIYAVNRGTASSIFDGDIAELNINEEAIYNFQDSNTNTYCYDASGNDNHGEIQNATGADRVESDNIAIGDMDSNGYTESDGVSYYRDQAATDLVLSGERSPNVNGFSVWYDSNGDRARSQFTGLLKADLYYSKGSFDSDGTTNYLDTGIVPNSNTIMRVWGKFNDISTTATMGQLQVDLGSRFFFGVQGGIFTFWVGGSGDAIVSADTNLHEFYISNAENGVDGTLVANTGSFTTTTQSIYLLVRNNNGARDLYTDFEMYKTEIQHNGQTHIWDFNADGNETVKYTIDGVEQTSPTIQGTVTSGQWSDNAIAQQATNRYDLIQADNLTTTDMYDTADVDNAVPLVVPITGDVTDNPLYIREDPFCWLLYNETLSTEENEAVDKYLGFSAPLLDGASDFLLDGGDKQITGTPQ